MINEWIVKNMNEVINSLKKPKKDNLDILADPADKKSSLRFQNEKLVSDSGNTYEYEENVPNLIYPEIMGKDKEFSAQYEQIHASYDVFAKFLFEMVYEDEMTQRKNLIDLLNLKNGEKVLEVSCGTGSNIEFLLEKVGSHGQVHALDLSKHMLSEAIKKHADRKNVFYYLANGSNLPFKDDTFDCLLHVGGINTFSDIESAMKEFMRVTKKGGTIIISDEGMQDNLVETVYGKIGISINSLYQKKPPMDKIPPNAREITLRYVLGGFFYVISFVKGHQYLFNLDLKVPFSDMTLGDQLKEAMNTK